MTKGKVVLVPFPFDDLSQAKMRPAVCLTDPLGPFEHVVLAFITSRIPDAIESSDLIFRPEDEDFAGTGLKVTSALRLHRLVTVSLSLIERELGRLSSSYQRQVADKLRLLFDL